MSHMWVTGKAPSHVALHDPENRLFDGNQKKMLHIAPEPELSRLIQKADYINYLSADLSAPNAMVKMDITDIQYPDNTFDVIYCSPCS